MRTFLMCLMTLSMVGCYRDSVPQCGDLGPRRQEMFMYRFNTSGKAVMYKHYINGEECR